MSKPPGGPLWPEHWAIQAAMDADRIEHRLATATARELTPAEAAAAIAVENHLAEARAACRPSGRRRRRSMLDRWRGTSVEQAYLHLHAAKIFMTDVLPDAEFDAAIPDVSTRLGMALDRNDPRRVEGEKMLHGSVGPARRAAVKQAMETAYDASDEGHVRLRDFRNIIWMAAAAVAVLTGLLVFLVAERPDSIPMCFDPGVTVVVGSEQTAAQEAQSVCPSGDQTRPSSVDILIVAGLGALGGALGGLIAIRNLRGTSTPYSVTTALAVLKVPAGALSTIIGMLLLAGGFVPGLTNLDSQRQILAYALVFGLAQQLVTRVADNRAQQILDNMPSKDPLGKPAQPPVVAPAPQPAPPADVVPTSPSDVVVVPVEDLPPVSVPPLEDPDDGDPDDGDPDDGDPDDGDPDDGDPDDGDPDDQGDGADLGEPVPAPVQATDAFLGRAEVEALTAEGFPLDVEKPDEFPDDEGSPEVTDEEAAQTGTDKG